MVSQSHGISLIPNNVNNVLCFSDSDGMNTSVFASTVAIVFFAVFVAALLTLLPLRLLDKNGQNVTFNSSPVIYESVVTTGSQRGEHNSRKQRGPHFGSIFDDHFPRLPSDDKEDDHSLVLKSLDDIDKLHEGDPAREGEALATMHLAVNLHNEGRLDKANKLFEHALALRPRHPDILTEYGQFLETSKRDVLRAESLYNQALHVSPLHQKAVLARRRALPLVEQLDYALLEQVDRKRNRLLSIPNDRADLRRAKREAYFQHVHHSVAIEGNTMDLVQTRHILETRMAVAGKSVLEHNEILGMDSALRFVDQVLVPRFGNLILKDVLDIHMHVLGNVDPFMAGRFRDTQVWVGSFQPPSPPTIRADMNSLVEWVNSEEASSLHPVELAAILHYKFVYIHPFIDGNGRTARLLMNLVLMQAGYPPIIIRLEDRLDYYRTLKLANDGDIRPFIRFVATSADKTLDSYLEQTTRFEVHQPDLTGSDGSEQLFIDEPGYHSQEAVADDDADQLKVTTGDRIRNV